jgi:hypothetical protein
VDWLLLCICRYLKWPVLLAKRNILLFFFYVCLVVLVMAKIGDLVIALDVAASEIYNEQKNCYVLSAEKKVEKSVDDLISSH